MAKRAIACGSSGFGIHFFTTKKEKGMHLGFAVRSGWADASTLPKMVLTQLKAPPSFPTESLSEL